MSARRTRQALEREYRVEVDHGLWWKWTDTWKTLRQAREFRALLRAEGEERDIRITRTETEVVE